MKKNSVNNSILSRLWRWTKFLVWLPWFFLTWPWQLRKAYSQVMSAISMRDDVKAGEGSSGYHIPQGYLHSVHRERLRARLN